MGRSKFDQETQVQQSSVYADTIVPSEANYETNPDSLQDDMNAVRSFLHELRDVRSTNWWRALTAPTAFPTEGAAARGVQNLNNDLWGVERKRVRLHRAVVGASAGPVGTSARHFVLDNKAAELPKNTVAAVGNVETRGTVVASVAGSFDAPSLVEVGGPDAIQPANLCLLVDTVTDGPFKDTNGREVYGLLQSESATDGHAINLIDRRVQVSFVVRNAAGDDLELASAGTMDGAVFSYSPKERFALDEIPESGWGPDPYLVGSIGISRQQHKALRQLIHFIDNGPAEGFASGAYRETTGTTFPTAVIWYDSAGPGKRKIVEKTIAWTGPFPTTITWKIYDSSEVLLATVTDAIAYSGPFETSRTRTIA
jgi:hypothetical protein